MHTDPGANAEVVALLRTAVVLELRSGHARAGAREAVAPLTEIISDAEEPEMIAAAASS